MQGENDIQKTEVVRLTELSKLRLEEDNYHEKYQGCKIALESAEARAVIAEAEGGRGLTTI